MTSRKQENESSHFPLSSCARLFSQEDFFFASVFLKPNTTPINKNVRILSLLLKIHLSFSQDFSASFSTHMTCRESEVRKDSSFIAKEQEV